MNTVVPESGSAMESAYLEYRRAGYEILRRHAQERGLFDALSQPRGVEAISEAMGFLPSRIDLVRMLLQALVRYGALQTDGHAYWRSTSATEPPDGFDRDLIAQAAGTEQVEQLLHGDSYAGIVDTLRSEHNKIGSAFVASNQALWDEFLQTPFYSYFRDLAVEAIAAPGAAVLDLAAGPGFGLADLDRVVGADGIVVGIDVSRDFVAEAVQRMQECPSVRVLQADLDEGLPFLRQAYFDGAMIVGAYHFLTRREELFAAAAALLKPAGRLCIAYVYCETGAFDQELMDLRLALREPLPRITTDAELTGLADRHGFDGAGSFTIGCFGWYLFERR
jgi:SAM-dependent methyltransferase